MPIIGLCGAGAVGKTEVLKVFEQKHGFKVFPSVVREVFGRHGYKTEADILAQSVDVRHQFQMEVFNTFLNRSEEYFKANPDANIITDRTLFDHIAYIIYNNQDINVDMIRALIDVARIHTNKWFKSVFYFPYPVSWSKEGSGEDGFRYLPPGKNFIIASMILSMTADHCDDFYLVPDEDIAHRAEYIRVMSTMRGGRK